MVSKVHTTSEGAVSECSVGWIGAGKMGAPMIRNLINRGIGVTISEPNPSQLAPLIASGAVAAHTLSEQKTSDIVFLTLPNDQVLMDVVAGSAGQPGLAAALAPGSVVVEMSTVSPGCSSRINDMLADVNVSYLRAPLSGSTALAEQATLTVLASGDKTAWETALPFLEIMSSRQFFLGEGEEARYMKLVLNTLVGATSAIMSEAVALGESGGLSRADMMSVICESAVSSPLLKYKADAIVSGSFDPAFTISQMIKDFTLISDAARSRGVPLFTTGLILEIYRSAANAGLKDQDFFALVKWHAQLSSNQDSLS